MLLFETDFWRVVLNPDQANIGKCVVIAKSQPSCLAELSPEEWLDFGEVTKKLEMAAQIFKPTHFNWVCLMNHNFNPDGSQKATPEVHWHFSPRVPHRVEIAGEVFEEKEYPRTVKTPRVVDELMLGEIAKLMGFRE